MAFAAILLMTGGCRSETGPFVQINTDDGPIKVRVELALTQADQTRGLMWRQSLDEDAGMLFVFEDEKPRSFWMKNTPLPLDIIYIDNQARIVSIAQHTTPFALDSIPSGGPARYVLEVNSGFSARNGVQPGQSLVLPVLASPPGT